MFVMTDGKRNDIGATMTAYATAHLGKTEVDGVELEAFGADALTVNGYLGTDGIQPLLDVCEKYDKGIFVLAKTSNPSSGELQDRQIDGKPVYEIMGEMCESWGSKQIGAYGYSAVGAVVAQPIRNSWLNCVRNCRTPCSWCRDTAHRAAAHRVLPVHLIKTAEVRS